MVKPLRGFFLYMPYKLNGNCVVKSDTGATVKCHDTHEQALAHLRALYANVPDAKMKSSDEAHGPNSLLGVLGLGRPKPKRIKHVGESIGTKELDSAVFRIYPPDETHPKHRWSLISSSGFEDRDGETIATKALASDSERMTRDNNYGPLRFWHVGSKSADPVTKDPGIGLDLGDCNFSAVHSHTRIELGEFYNEDVAKSLIPHTKEFGASLGFFFPENSGKDITKIHTFERSVLPHEPASNLMSRLKRIFTQEDSMEDKQLMRLKELIGDDGVGAILADVEKREADLKANGVKLKAKKILPDPPAPKVNPTGAKTEDESGENPKEEAGESKKEEDAEDAGEMKKKTKELVDQISDAIAVKMSDKFVTPAMLDAKFNELTASKTKETSELATTLKSITDDIATLKGETPESKRGFKASESGDTLANSALTMQLLTQMAQGQGLDLSALGVKGAGPQTDMDRIANKMFKANGK